MVDAQYLTNGLLERAMDLVDNFVNKLEIEGLEKKVFKFEGSVPLVVYKIEGTKPYAKNIMMYGHLDKQPYDEPWEEGLAPTIPVIKDGKMYGRGVSDDGYAVFSTMLAIKAA